MKGMRKSELSGYSDMEDDIKWNKEQSKEELHNDIVEMLNKADERKLKLIWCYVKGILGLS